MNKAILIQHIVDKLTVDISLYLKAASAARAEATHTKKTLQLLHQRHVFGHRDFLRPALHIEAAGKVFGLQPAA